MSYFTLIYLPSLGAYGAAVLYKKKDDDSLVILKEINLHDLKAAERQMALNEVTFTQMIRFIIGMSLVCHEKDLKLELRGNPYRPAQKQSVFFNAITGLSSGRSEVRVAARPDTI